jgi:hypothetical protein
MQVKIWNLGIYIMNTLYNLKMFISHEDSGYLKKITETLFFTILWNKFNENNIK